jgi:3-oxoacyl-[acyl-carrier protein] reductase
MSKLTGKVAIVTGASKGIGAGIAKALAAAGASVIVNYASDKAGADTVVSEIVASGGKASAVRASVNKSADVIELFAATKQVFGRLDILVNNAGVYGFAPLSEFTEAEYQRQMDTNVLGLLLATQEGVLHFGSQGGVVINIGTAGTTMILPRSVLYTATKGAVDSITRVLAKELGPQNIRVNSVNPGIVITEGLGAIGFTEDSAAVKGMAAMTPLGRPGRPKDIGDVVAFLASDDARWVTGQLLQAAGGLQ